MNIRSVAAGFAGCLMALLLALPGAQAQGRFPDRTITIIVPFAAGGPTDVVARQLAEAMSRDLGVSVVAENVTGAGGTIGGQRVAQARPDGYTLLLGNIGVATAPYPSTSSPSIAGSTAMSGWTRWRSRPRRRARCWMRCGRASNPVR